MLKKTIYTTLILFAGYTIFLIMFAPEWWQASQHQGQDNMVKAQHFLYENKSYKNVIVGSSLSCRLITDSLPNTYNLSFGGHSVLDGLKILVYSPNLPKNIYVETNVIIRSEDPQFTSDVLDPLFFNLRKDLPSLRVDKQPIGVIGDRIIKKIIYPIYYSGIIRRLAFWKSQPADVSAINKELKIDNKDTIAHTYASDNKAVDTTSIYSKMLQLQIEEYSVYPNKKNLDSNFLLLRKYVNELEKRGVNIVFFEIPVDKKLVQLPKAKSIRENFYSYFPMTKYKYIPIQSSVEYQTTDGEHLDVHDALKYTLYLKTVAFSPPKI